MDALIAKLEKRFSPEFSKLLAKIYENNHIHQNLGSSWSSSG